MLSNAKIANFWKWFESVCDEFGDKFENTTLIDELDWRISDLGDFGWELGPGQELENMLVISPNGDIGKLPDCEFINSLSPVIGNWEFHATKPKKGKGLTFYYRKDKEYKVDASDWEYYLLKVDENYFDIVIVAKNILEFSESDRISIGEILLDNILGEQLRIKSFQYVHVHSNIDSGYAGSLSSIKDLENHLKYLRK